MIGRNIKNFTGFILQDNEKIYFHMQDRIFNFISEEVGLVAAFKKKTIISQEYFLHGYTSDGYQIAVYTGYEKRNISANYKLRPGLYIISKSNMNFYDMTKFQAIEFIGGTLNNLYQQTVIETKYDDSQKCYIKKYPESRKEYKITLAKVFIMAESCHISGKSSLGGSFCNTMKVLNFTFILILYMILVRKEVK